MRLYAIRVICLFLLMGCTPDTAELIPTPAIIAVRPTGNIATLPASDITEPIPASTAVISTVDTPTPPATTSPVATPARSSQADISSDLPTPTSAPTIGPLPPGDWAVRAFDTNDASIIIVNGQLVGASTYGHQQTTDWININSLLTPGSDNFVTVANWNARYHDGAWGFSIRRDETVIWGAEGDTRQEYSLNYAQTVTIKPDGSVEPILPDTGAYPTLSDAWSVRVRDTADVGVMLVNGLVVAGAGNWGLADTDWVDISGLLRAAQDNTISMHVWNFEADYAWRLSIRRNETTVWESERSGGGLPGAVFSEEVIITSNGEVIP